MRRTIRLPDDAGYRAWLTADHGPAVDVEVEVDGIEEPYMTAEARRMHERAMHPRVLHARLPNGQPVEVVAETVTEEVRAYNQKLLDEAPATRLRRFHRTIVDLPASGRARAERIRSELDWFVRTRLEPEEQTA